jgi:hypothetical protein
VTGMAAIVLHAAPAAGGPAALALLGLGAFVLITAALIHRLQR